MTNDKHLPEKAQSLPWGDHPYDNRTVADVIYDYALIRGDLCEQYARDQLADWIERLVQHERAEALREYASELDWKRPDRSPCESFEDCCGSEASCDAMQPVVRIVGASSLRKRADQIEASVNRTPPGEGA